METKILHLAGKLLLKASDEFEKHGCNDLSRAILSEFTEEEKETLSLLQAQWNEKRLDPTEYEIGEHSSLYYDWILMGFLGDYLIKKQ